MNREYWVGMLTELAPPREVSYPGYERVEFRFDAPMVFPQVTADTRVVAFAMYTHRRSWFPFGIMWFDEPILYTAGAEPTVSGA